jgi:hypothetical protein
MTAKKQRMTATEKRIRRDYTEISHNGIAYETWLIIGCQSFVIATSDNRDSARWYRVQIAKALAAFLADNKRN